VASHAYHTTLIWTGNQGDGTKTYKSYVRSYDVQIEGKPVLHGSADPNYLGDASLHNPEDLLVASLSACHMLWYLHLCASNKIVLQSYQDEAEGTMQTNKDGSGEFKEVVLRPKIVLSEGDIDKARDLHGKAHDLCFISRSVNFPVRCEPEIVMES